MDVKLPKSPPIAIVGMASHFPDAVTLFDFWKNINQKRDSITDNTGRDGYWDKEIFYDPDPNCPDKTYAYKAGWIPPIDFDPVEFKLPPMILDSISTAQLFSLHVAKKVLQDASIIGTDNCQVDHDKVGVILGGAGNGNTSFSLAARQQAPYLKAIIKNSGLPGYVADDIVDRLLDQYLEWNEDSFPGFLGNVACGRISSFFDLGGTSNMVDAACASSLAAVKSSIGELADGSCDAVLTGGSNLENSIFSFLCFSKTPALSRTNTSRPFDEKSDGMMLGDGVGMLVLKRLEDAEKHGDKIYAVINALSATSDGRAKSIFAPRYEGQVRAVKRAYDYAGITAKDIQLIEAHGTGTVAGDQTEVRSLKSVYGECELEKNSIALGSIKSQIGHTRCAAGAASMIKVALGLHHKVLPPTINVKKPNKHFDLEDSPFYINTESRPWIRHKDQGPRRAAVSAFGFGGTNYHVVLEEYQAEHSGKYCMMNLTEVVIFQARTPKELLKKCEQSLTLFQSEEGESEYRDYLQSQSNTSVPLDFARLAFASESKAQTESLLGSAISQLKKNLESGWDHPLGIYFKPCAKATAGRVVALFPGQGSQYVNMACKVANEFPEMRATFADFDVACKEEGKEELSRNVYPAPAFSEEERERQNGVLQSTDNAQPAIGAVSLGYYKILQNMGFIPDFVAGHSYGELTALHVAGVIDEAQFFKLSIARGKAMRISRGDSEQDTGSMLAAAISLDRASQEIAESDDLYIANVNSDNQIVIGGATSSVESLYKKLKNNNVQCAILPVSAAFHTRYVQQAYEPFKEELNKYTFKKPAIPLYSNASGERYPQGQKQAKEKLSSQLINPVQFKKLIENIYSKGGNCFVEIGPKGVLSKLVAEILDGKEHTVVSLDPSVSTDESEQLRKALAKLVVEGVPLKNIDQYLIRPPLAEKKGRLTYRLNGGFFFSENGEKRRKRGHRVDTQNVDRFVNETLEEKLTQQLAEKKEEWLAEQAEKNEKIPQTFAKTPSHTAPGNGHASNNGHARMNGGNGRSNGSARKEVLTEKLSTEKLSTEKFNHGGISLAMSNNEIQPTNGTLNVLDAQIQAQHMVNEVHQQFQDNQKDYIQFLNGLINQQFALLDKHNDSANFKDMIGSLDQSFQLLDRNQQYYHTNHERYFLNQQALMGGSSGFDARVQASAALPAAIAPAQLATSSVASPSLSPQQAVSASNAAPAAAATAPAAPPVQFDSSMARESLNISAPSLPTLPTEQVAEDKAKTNGAGGGIAVPVAVPQEVTTGVRQLTEADLEALRKLEEAVTPETLTRELIRIISEKTGYPEDMIGVEMDLEADLGIDSIKRIEIIGAMFDSFSAEMDMEDYEMDEYDDPENFDIDQFSTIERMVDFMIQSMTEIIEHIRSGDAFDESTGATVESTAEEIPAVEEAPLLLDSPESGISATVEDADAYTVMKNIGFVTSTSDLEAAEQHSDPKSEPANPSGNMVGEAGAATAENTVEKSIAPKLIAETQVLDSDDDLPPIQRFVVSKQILPAPDQREVVLPEGYIWLITDDGQGVSDEVAAQLLNKGGKVARISLGSTRAKNKIDKVNDYFVEHNNEEALVKTLEEIKTNDGSIGGFIYLQPTPAVTKSVRTSFIEKDYDAMQMLFLTTKHLQADLNNAAKSGQAFFFLVSRLDGQLGTGEEKLFSLVSSGVSGLAKSLHHEWNNVFCRTLDVQAKIKKREVADILTEELQDTRIDLLEVGRVSKNDRCTLTITLQEIAAKTSKKASKIGPDDVFLVSGGARGITAECVIALAQKHPARFILLGRTDIEAARPEWAQDGDDLNTLRAAAIKYIQSKNEQPTPVKVDRLLKQVIHTGEVKNTIEKIEAAGGKAVYISADILEKKDLTSKLRGAEKLLGKVTGIIHGAGNLADKKIEKKTADDFSSVFLTKVKGLENIIQVVEPGKIKHIVMFSSVSGYFGNAGQTDYSMANEVLNKFSHLFKGVHKTAFVKAINWGPWDSGMVNETLKKAYKDRGISIIPLDIGAEFFVNEFSAGKSISSAQVIVGSEKYQSAKPVKVTDSIQTLTRVINPLDNPFLNSHVIDQHAVLPATCAMGWMVNALENILPGYEFTRFENFKVLKGIVFNETEAKEFSVEVTPVVDSENNAKIHRLKVSIFNEMEGKRQNRYSGVVIMQLSPVLEALKIEVNLSKTAKLSNSLLYSEGDKAGLLFHGPAFKGTSRILNMDDKSITTACNLAPVSSSEQGQFSVGSFNPYLVDVSLQAPYLWLPLNTEFAGLPTGVVEAEQFMPLDFDQEFFVTATMTSQTGSKLITDIHVHDEKGNVFMRLSGVEFTVSKKLKKTLIPQDAAEVVA